LLGWLGKDKLVEEVVVEVLAERFGQLLGSASTGHSEASG
jgi:hypothetical protein